jgi:hypothetical protein
MQIHLNEPHADILVFFTFDQKEIDTACETVGRKSKLIRNFVNTNNYFTNNIYYYLF